MEHGIYTEIPVGLLWPTQPVEHYRRPSTRYVIQILSMQGSRFLRDNPISVILVSNSHLAIYDGHHRARFAPKFGIRMIPSLVTDINTVAEVFNRDGGRESEIFECDMGEAIISMAGRLKPEKCIVPAKIPTLVRDAQELTIWLREMQGATHLARR